MTWIKARFYLNQEGHYTICWLHFGPYDWEVAVSKFISFTHGYEAATGCKCVLDQLQTNNLQESRGNGQFVIPQEISKLTQFLKNHGEGRR